MKYCESYKRIHVVHCSLFPPKYYKYGWDRINVTTQKKIIFRTDFIFTLSNAWYYQYKIPQGGKGEEFKISSRMT